MHECPRCGERTEGSYSAGGVLWAICPACMAADRKRAEEEAEDFERRDAQRLHNGGEE